MNKPADPLFETIVETIRRAAEARSRPFVVAIDGRSGAGKSSFAACLSEHLGATILEGDDFFAGGVSVSSETAERLARTCIDWQRLRGVLERLVAGEAARYHPFDWDRFDGSLSSAAVTLAPSRIILVEGVYAARPELADLVDCAILLTLADDLREDRLLRREGALTDWERQWHRAEDWYFARQAQLERFDFVVATDD